MTEQPAGEPKSEPSLVWNPEKRQLVNTEVMDLPQGIEKMDLGMISGVLEIIEAGAGEKSFFQIETVYSADSEEKARQHLQENPSDHKIDLTDRALFFEDNTKGTGIVFGGIMSGVTIVNNEVTINGRRITPDSGSGVGVEKRVKLVVPKGKELDLGLRNQSGDISLEKARGKARLKTTSGDIRVGEFIGDLSVDSSSGKAKIDKFSGELRGGLSSGDFRIRQLTGSVNLRTSSGEVRITDAVLRGRNNSINCSSGDVELGISNESLVITTEVSSGEIDLDRNGFTVERESEKKGRSGGITVIRNGGNSVVSIGSVGGSGRSYVEGYYGEKDNAPELTIGVSSGDIEVKKTGRNIKETVVNPTDAAEYADCSYCSSAYSTDQIRVDNGEIIEIVNPTCPHCSASEPKIHGMG